MKQQRRERGFGLVRSSSCTTQIGKPKQGRIHASDRSSAAKCQIFRRMLRSETRNSRAKNLAATRSHVFPGQNVSCRRRQNLILRGTQHSEENLASDREVPFKAFHAHPTAKYHSGLSARVPVFVHVPAQDPPRPYVRSEPSEPEPIQSPLYPCPFKVFLTRIPSSSRPSTPKARPRPCVRSCRVQVGFRALAAVRRLASSPDLQAAAPLAKL